jgi:hypothetical protein
MACIFPPRSLSIAVHLAGVRPLPLARCDSQALHFTCRGGRGGDGGGGCGGGGRGEDSGGRGAADGGGGFGGGGGGDGGGSGGGGKGGGGDGVGGDGAGGAGGGDDVIRLESLAMGPAVPFPSGPPPERTYRAARASVPTAKPRARRSRDAVMWPKLPGASSSFRLDLVRFVLLRAPAAAFGLRGGLRAALQPSHVRTMPPASISSAAPPFWSSNRATSPADLLALRGALGGFLLAFLGRPTTAGGGSSKSSSIPSRRVGLPTTHGGRSPTVLGVGVP